MKTCDHFLFPSCGCPPTSGTNASELGNSSGPELGSAPRERGSGSNPPASPQQADHAVADTVGGAELETLAPDPSAPAEIQKPKKQRNPRHANGAKQRSNAGRHSKATPRWGTEDKIVEAIRRVMGGIDFDACSESVFNEVVRADEYFSLLERGEDALKLPWRGTKRLVNPPGGLVPEFWRRMCEQSASGIQSCWVGFSVEQLGILADESHHPSDFAICFLRKRIKFKRHDGFSGSPSHSNYVSGVNVDPAAFLREFGPLGKVQFGAQLLGSEWLEALLKGAR